jgi:hypothetical protein
MRRWCPGARVTAKNINTGIERTTETDDQGNYTIAELQTGSYEVTIRQPGFQTAIVTNVIVGVSAERRVDVSLVVAGADTVVQVVTATQVETTSNTLGGTITQKVVSDMPVNVGFLPITVTPDVGIGNPFLGGGGSRNIQFAARLIF